MLASLHGHTFYSDGVNSPEDVLQVARECGISVVGITDHGTMAGTYACLSSAADGISAVAGLEAYHYMPVSDDQKAKKAYHITLLALNDVGYKTLCSINYNAWRNFYKYPIADVVGRYYDGVACLTGCPQSYFATCLRDGNVDAAIEWVNRLRQCYPVVAVEIMGGAPIYDLYVDKAMDVARKLGLLPVSTKDYHYCRRSESDIHAALMVAKGRGALDGLYALESPIETIAGREGIENAIRLFGGVQYTRLSTRRVSVDISDDEVVNLVYERARQLGPQYVERATNELSVIRDLDMLWYIKMLYDICKQLREAGILYEARGSASGSLVCYLLGITCIDPIKYGLLFERFMSRKRREMPDVDIDVPASKRDDILSLLRQRWNVAKMLTVNSVGEKLAKHCVNRIAERSGIRIEESKLVGRVYNTGVHASGIVLWPKNEISVVPVRHVDGEDVVECTMDTVPYVKWDLLGQKTLDVITDTFTEIANSRSIDDYFRWRDDVVLQDEAVKRSMLYVYRTSAVGVFQLEGNMRSMLGRRLFTSVEELARLVAIYRPAVLASGVVSDIFDDKPIDPLISANCRFGYPIYQEDLMMILHKVVGIPLEDSYSIVKQAAKKNQDVLDDIEKRIRSVMEHDPQRCENILQILKAYFGYGFNVAHAVAYAVRMAITAYMRMCADDRYMLSLLRRETSPLSVISYQLYMQNVLGYKILPSLRCGIDADSKSRVLYVGIDFVKHVSRKDAEIIERNSGRGSLVDFVSGCVSDGISKRAVEAMDACGITRFFWDVGAGNMMAIYEAILYNTTRKRKRVPVPNDVARRDSSNVLFALNDICSYTSHAGVLLYPVPVPAVRISRVGKSGVFSGAVYRAGDEHYFVDGVGEVYELQRSERLDKTFVCPYVFVGERQGNRVVEKSPVRKKHAGQ
jgi:DNA polymerase III subunit alpha